MKNIIGLIMVLAILTVGCQVVEGDCQQVNNCTVFSGDVCMDNSSPYYCCNLREQQCAEKYCNTLFNAEPLQSKLWVE